MWETLHNNADMDCFKTPILQEILRIQNLHQVEHCAFSGDTRLCQQVGCARNRPQCHTVLQKLKSFLSMQVYAWTVFPLSLSGIWLLECSIVPPTNKRNPMEEFRETCCRPATKPNMHTFHAKTERRRKGCVQVATSSDEYFLLSYVVEFLCRIKSDCIEKFEDVWSFGETR